VENINITEQLNKFKKLINAKSGEVILEETADSIYREIWKAKDSSDDLVKVINKITTSQIYDGVDAILAKNVPADRNSIAKILNKELGFRDANNAGQIKQALTKIGKKFTFNLDGNNSVETDSVKVVATPAVANSVVTNVATDRQKNINLIYCSVKNGIITNPSSQFKNTSWEDWKKAQKPTDAEIQVAKKSCPQRRRNPSQQGATINDRFTKSVQSLGIQNGKMDVDTLQKILTSLEGSETKAKTANDFSPQGVPADAFNSQEVPDTNL